MFRLLGKKIFTILYSCFLLNWTYEYQSFHLLATANHLLFMASKFSDFKKLTYWRILILAVSQFNKRIKHYFPHINVCQAVPSDNVLQPNREAMRTATHLSHSGFASVNTEKNVLLSLLYTILSSTPGLNGSESLCCRGFLCPETYSIVKKLFGRYRYTLEDLTFLKRSPDLLNNVKIDQDQLWIIMKPILFYWGCGHFGQVT